MSTQTLDQFFAWLDIQLKDRGWIDKQLAKKADISPSVISKARSGYQGVGWEAAIAIAQALDLPPTSVLRRVGLLPLSELEPMPSEEEMLTVFRRLSEEDQEEILQIMRLKDEREKQDKRGKRSKN